jgi:hypothetical protein
VTPVTVRDPNTGYTRIYFPGPSDEENAFTSSERWSGLTQDSPTPARRCDVMAITPTNSQPASKYRSVIVGELFVW